MEGEIMRTVTSLSAIKRLLRAIETAHRIKDIPLPIRHEGCWIYYDVKLDTVGREYRDARLIISFWPRVERWLEKRNLI